MSRHRAGFELQHVQEEGEARQILGEAARARTAVHLVVPPFTLLVVLESFTSGHQLVCEIVAL
jgi:hypothetical protein